MIGLLIVVVGFLAAACTSGNQYSAIQIPTAQLQATAPLRSAQNEEVGLATFTQRGDRVTLQVTVTNLPPGRHGIHVHEVGSCAPPGFESAGAHFNPGHTQHGLDNPLGPHAGDLMNLEVGADGTGQLTTITNRLTLSNGASSIFDADGSSLVIHALEDDQRTDPAGNSGARIACGVVQMT